MTDTVVPESGVAERQRDRSESLWRRLLANRQTVVSGIVLLLIIFVAVLGDNLVPHDPIVPNFAATLQPPSAEHLFGTDELGRDVLARVLAGAKYSLLAGLIPTTLAALVGSALGLIAGYVGGRTDGIMMRGVDVLLAFPSLVLLLAISAVLGPGLFNGLIAIAVVMVPRFVRVVRADVLTLINEEFIVAARTLGYSSPRIVLRHIMPNALASVIVIGTLAAAEGILAESSLSFLGLGVQPPEPSWGGMISQGFRFLRLAPWISFAPGAAIFITVLAVNFLGDGLRDVLDPTIGRRRRS